MRESGSCTECHIFNKEHKRKVTIAITKVDFNRAKGFQTFD